MSTTVRVSDDTHARLAALATSTGRKMQTVLQEAIETYEAAVFWKAFNDGYTRLANDPGAWAEIQDERAVQQRALSDRIDP